MTDTKNSIHHIRKNIFGVTQQDFAAIAGVQQSMVSRWENNEASPTLAEINRIRQAAADGRKLKRRWDDRLFFKSPETGAAA
jgi:DNA-binding transcriptional regulator YiaG